MITQNPGESVDCTRCHGLRKVSPEKDFFCVYDWCDISTKLKLKTH